MVKRRVTINATIKKDTCETWWKHKLNLIVCISEDRILGHSPDNLSIKCVN